MGLLEFHCIVMFSIELILTLIYYSGIIRPLHDYFKFPMHQLVLHDESLYFLIIFIKVNCMMSIPLLFIEINESNFSIPYILFIRD
jgi:hypothetical protein